MGKRLEKQRRVYLQFHDVLRQFGRHSGQRLLPAVHDAPLFARARVRALGLLVFDAGTAFHRFPVEIAVCGASSNK